jgi:hypothetical protein
MLPRPGLPVGGVGFWKRESVFKRTVLGAPIRVQISKVAHSTLASLAPLRSAAIHPSGLGSNVILNREQA